MKACSATYSIQLCKVAASASYRTKLKASHLYNHVSYLVSQQGDKDFKVANKSYRAECNIQRVDLLFKTMHVLNHLTYHVYNLPN